MTQMVPTNVLDDNDQDSKEQALCKCFLMEWDFIKSAVKNITANGGAHDFATVRHICAVMDKYQEQSQLLEPYLEAMVSPVIHVVRAKMVQMDLDSNPDLEVIKPLCVFIYSLVTICGYKVVTKFFPHQVSDLEPAVSLLEKCHIATSQTSLRQESTGEMETQCIVLLWLTILVLIPFDISSVDTHVLDSPAHTGVSEFPPLVLRLLVLTKDYLSSPGPTRGIAALLISRLLTRPDMSKPLHSFIEWTHEVLSSVKDEAVDHFQLLGATEALAAIFKVGRREVLSDLIPRTWSSTSKVMQSKIASRSALLRRFMIKLSQRLGLACLPCRASSSWPYMERPRIFGEMTTSIVNDVTYSGYADDEAVNIPDDVEGIIDVLLCGLRDSDTSVRWAAAKGIGRVTSCLTISLADEVFSHVLKLFSSIEGDCSWHGGCLALAELARRGLLAPSNLSRIVPIIIKALHYDVRRGSHSVGSHVRDAASYVCWAFGRAYTHSDMKGIFEQLAPHLVTVACYDREVNCRRAAAAAFQENVGRQGSFLHGIDIINCADYFSLSSRLNSYLNVAVVIGQYQEFLYLLVEELLCSKICHWDKDVRQLAARALSALVKYDLKYFCDVVLERLIPCTLSSDLCMRHGATLAIAELILALHLAGHVLSAEKQKQVSGIIPAIEKARLYRGKGGEIMHSCVSRLIECTAIASIQLPVKIKLNLLGTLDENLRHPNAQIQVSAVEALKKFVPSYLCDPMEEQNQVSKYLTLSNDANMAARRGSALALGVLPFKFLKNRWMDILRQLCKCCLVQSNPDECDAEARVNAVCGLVAVCETLTRESECILFSDLEEYRALHLFIKSEVIGTLLKAVDDYSVDNRGDVGSWIREAAMDGLEKCTYFLCKSGLKANGISSLFDQNLATTVIGCILKQAAEKIDKMREKAGKTLHRILHNSEFRVPFICHREKLEEVVPNDADFEWGVPILSFPRLVNLLQFDCYSKSLLSGLVISTGGLQESLSKASIGALVDYLETVHDKEQRKTREYMLSIDILWVLHQYEKSDRVIVPTLKTVEILFSKRFFMDMELHASKFQSCLLASLETEMKTSRNFSKLYTGISVLGYLSSIQEPISSRALSQLLHYLGHQYPKIRKASADQVYLILVHNAILFESSKIDQALNILSGTCWDHDISEAKIHRLELFEMANLEVLDIDKVNCDIDEKKNGRRKATFDENESYSTLVDSTGF